MDLTLALPTPDLFQAERILCVQPHYDDNDIGAGGTLAALCDSGVELIYLTVTDDLMGVLDPTLSPQAATAQLRREQRAAGDIIGVQQQLWLGYPDAGRYDYFDLRRDLIRTIRQLRPDFVLTVDPWLPYEGHNDHVQTGRAAVEAALMYKLLRIASDPLVDSHYTPHELKGVAFYFTAAPNFPVDISATRARKNAALSCYQAQFTPQDSQELLMLLDAREAQYGSPRGWAFGEALRVMHPMQLHCGL